MVLMTIADVTLEVGIWGAKKIYGLSYWLVWGTPKTETEILLEKQNERIQILHKDLTIINERLRRIEEKRSDDKDTINKNVSMDINDTSFPIEILDSDIS